MSKASGNNFLKIALKMFLYILSGIAAILLIIIGILLYLSPGTPEKFKDDNNLVIECSISEKVFVNIGGVRQGMFICGKNMNNPVLLYVHGGPAFPNYFLIDKYKPGLEDHFTVCYWEQRGGGLSYSKGVTPESMTFEQLTKDAIEVTNYLRKRFGQDKIFLMAHSGGTAFAIKAAEQAPELYHAYIGIAQITRQLNSERIAYQYMLDQYKKERNHAKVKELQQYPVMRLDTAALSFYKSLVRDQSMHELGIGTMHSMRSVFTGVFIPVWLCKAYTLKEKCNIWKSKFTFLKQTNLFKELFETDLPAQVTKLMIPVYFMSGKYDLTVNYSLSRDYLESLDAPIKGFYTFEHSAHSPIYEEPSRFIEIMVKDVAGLTNELADKPGNN
jgi:pimeloyl-ACP methyl ester carboxylesterase